MITRWPHVLVEDGPPIAGLERGDTIAFAPEDWVFINAVHVTGSRLALSVSSATGPSVGDAWRLRADPPRIEHRDASLEWRASDGVAHATPWRLRLVLDGPPLATVKRFGAHVAVHPTWLDGAYGGIARSQWVLAKGGARESLIVEETLDGAVSFRAEPRRSGVRVHDLARLGEGKLDRETAAGIVAQMRDRQPTTWIGFDGVARAIEHSRAAGREGRVEDVYGALTRGALRDDAVRAELAAEIASTRKATPAEIGAVVRTLGADAWDREQALVEECGVLAG